MHTHTQSLILRGGAVETAVWRNSSLAAGPFFKGNLNRPGTGQTLQKWGCTGYDDAGIPSNCTTAPIKMGQFMNHIPPFANPQ